MEKNRVSGSEEWASDPSSSPTLLDGIGTLSCIFPVSRHLVGRWCWGMGQPWYDFPTRDIYQLRSMCIRAGLIRSRHELLLYYLI